MYKTIHSGEYTATTYNAKDTRQIHRAIIDAQSELMALYPLCNDMRKIQRLEHALHVARTLVEKNIKA